MKSFVSLERTRSTYTTVPEFDAIRGHRSAHSLPIDFVSYWTFAAIHTLVISTEKTRRKDLTHRLVQ